MGEVQQVYIFQDSMECLGRKFISEGLHTTTKKIDAVHLAPVPKDQHG